MSPQRTDRLHVRLALATACFGLGLLAMLAARPADAAVFSNPTAITIPTAGDASPNPSTITVSGLSGATIDVNVTLRGFSHTFPGDVGVVLMPPSGQTILLMQEAGDTTDAFEQTITFDDSAPSPIPDVGALNTGSYRPASYNPGFEYPSPGPGFAYCNPGPTGFAPFCTLGSALNGSSPNGTWKLFIRDFNVGNGGSIAGGWSLDVSVPPPAQPPAPAPDTTAPTVTLSKKPPKKGTAHKIKFVFSSNEAGSTFRCKLDKGAFKACTSPFKKTVGVGSHSFEVKATDAAGNTGSAKHSFKVVKKPTH